MSGGRATGLQAHVALTRGGLAVDVSLEVAAGEMVAVVGPNGAGKTTLLHAIAGLVPIDEGRVVLDGETLEAAPGGLRLAPEHRRLSIMFQDHALFPHMSALENVAFGLRARGMRAGAARGRATDWVARMGLTDVAALRPPSLSGGQAQRVALARALAVDPALLLLDEPLAALDAETRPATRQELGRHLDGVAAPRVLVTHDPVDAFALASRIIVMEGGHIVQDGSPEELAARPRSSYVAAFVGVNLYRGRAEGDTVVIDDTVLHAAGAGHGPVFAVVHPHSVAVHRQAPGGSPRNTWEGTVDSLEADGPRARVRVRGPLPMVAEITPAAVAELGLVAGTSVWLSVKATDIAVYSA